IVSEQSPIDAATTLWQALQAGLIVPISQVYKFFQDMGQGEAEHPINPRYRFLHDRIQQAAYSLIPEDRKQATHLKLGQLLQQNLSEVERAEKLFEIVRHLNLGQALVQDANQRESLAQLNLAAGQKAKQATAYAAAHTFIQTGLELLTADCWQSQYELALALHVTATETAYLNTDFEAMESIAAVVLERAQTQLDKVKIYQIQINALTAQSRMLEAIVTGANALAAFGIEFSSEPDQALMGEVMQKVAVQLEGKPIGALTELPAMSDPQTIAVMQLLAELFAPVFLGKPTLLPLLAVTMVSLSLEFGNTPASAIGYVAHGMVLSSFMGEVEQGYQFGKVALSLLAQFNAKAFQSLTLLLFGGFLQHRKESLQATIPTVKEGYLVGMETGNFLYAGYNSSNYFYDSLFAGVPLEAWESEIENYCVVLAEAKQNSPLAYLKMKQQLGYNLREAVEEPDRLIGTAYDETVMFPKHHQDNESIAIALACVYKLIPAYLFGNHTRALDYIDQINLHLMTFVGMPHVPVFHFYGALTYLALYSNQSKTEQAETLLQVEQHQSMLVGWAHHAPMNYQHKVDLIDAEKCRVLGQNYEAADKYDRAIAGAKANEYIQEEALANELAAKFYLDWDRERVAADYMQAAYYGYAKWGAQAKLADLETRYPQLLTPILQQQQTSLSATETVFASPNLTIAQTPSSHTSSSGSTSISATLDLETVLKTYQTLSSEIELDKLLATLLHTVLEAAGADKGALLMPHKDGLFVEAIATLNQPARVESISLSDSPEIPHSLINIVKRSLQPSIIMDAAAHPTLAMDAYVMQHHPKSLLCTPILQRGKLIAILYLENRVTVGAFTHDRVELLNLLCTQAAISLENARLYQQEQIKSEELAQKEAEYRSIFESVNDGLMIIDLATGQIVAANPTACKMHGYSQEEWSTLQPSDIIHPRHLHEFERFIETLNHGEEFYVQAQDICKDGRVFDVEVKAVPLMYQGKLHGLSIIRDISDRKAAETALVESERYHRSLFETSSIGLLLCTIDGQFVYANTAYANILGRTVAELPALSYWDITPRKYAEDEQRQLHSLQTTGRYGPYEKEYIHKNGSLVPVRLSGVIVERHGEQLIWSSIEDISDRKAAEKLVHEKNVALERTLDQLQQSQAQVVQAEKMSALGNLVAGVAHEINNPIGFLNGSINNAKDYVQDILNHLALYQQHHPNAAKPVQENAEEIDLEFLEKDLPKLLDSMEGATKRIKNISVSLRTFSRADTDHKISANLHEGLDSTLLILKYRLKANECRPAIEVVKDYGDIPTVECFPGQLNQVFMNILANAIDALDEASQNRSFAEIKTNPNRITICTTLEHRQVKIAIADNGLGISDEVKARIFDHLFTTKEVGKGTGLGLAIAHQIVVETHGGSLEVESMEGEGTVFFIQLPL
ncbi:ATP-binding sensor histidine kinase, partial [Vacuolonema iberomarrocanum]|uniref:ATP-binding sensor histidine kinase n=1 Tax=Vacuolonema iberomarrocanum TaxID=3454632 RepID=UPI0019E729A9|nr:PAS domain S-box protein [filamentous cyanobacterium LEGE 07170]